MVAQNVDSPMVYSVTIAIQYCKVHLMLLVRYIYSRVSTQGIPQVQNSAGIFYFRTSETSARIDIKFRGIPKSEDWRNAAVSGIPCEEFRICMIL